MTSTSRSHVCVELSLDPYGILIEIGLGAGCKLFTNVPGRKKFPVSPASAISSLFVIFVSDVEYSVSVVLFFQLLMIVVLSFSSSSSSVSSSANILQVLCWLGYKTFTEFSFRLCLSILSVLDYVSPNCHPYHFFLLLLLVDPLLALGTVQRVPRVGNTDERHTSAAGQHWTGEPLKHRLISLLSYLLYTTIGSI